MAGNIVHYDYRLFLSKDGTQTCHEVCKLILIDYTLLNLIIEDTNSIRDGDNYCYIVASLS